MTRLYKLTDRDGKTRAGTHNETQWGENVTHTASGRGRELCTSDVIHAYEHPLVAAVMNPAHANLSDPVLWEATGEVVARDGALKCGVKTLTTLRRIPLPVLTTEQRVRIAIRCALDVYTAPAFVIWARGWLDGADRSRDAARAAAADAARAAAAACAAAYADAYAAAAAAEAAYAADDAADAADAAYAAAAAAAARAAADAARAARAGVAAAFDLVAIIQESIA